MQATPTQRFQTLSIITVAAIFALIAVGGIVRVTGSGLGCPDWPLCYGQVLPPRNVTAWIEFSHRVVAAIGGVLILATAGIIWKRYRHIKLLYYSAIVQIAVLVIQIPLGGIIVFTELEPLAVAIHLGQAMIIFALGIVIAFGAYRYGDEHNSDPLIPYTRGYLALLGGAAFAAFVLLMTGALVVGTQSSYACPGWPLCHGQVFPAEGANYRLWLQMGHRYTVAVVSVLLVATAFVTLRRSERAPGARVWSWLLLGLLVGQIAVGAIQVLTHLQWYWRALHLSMASAVWAALIALMATTIINGVLVPARRERRVDAPSVVPSPGK